MIEIQGIDVLKITALVIVGAGGLYAIGIGHVEIGGTLLGSILGYVFGNAHGIKYAQTNRKGG